MAASADDWFAQFSPSDDDENEYSPSEEEVDELPLSGDEESQLYPVSFTYKVREYVGSRRSIQELNKPLSVLVESLEDLQREIFATATPFLKGRVDTVNSAHVLTPIEPGDEINFDDFGRHIRVWEPVGRRTYELPQKILTVQGCLDVLIFPFGPINKGQFAGIKPATAPTTTISDRQEYAAELEARLSQEWRAATNQCWFILASYLLGKREEERETILSSGVPAQLVVNGMFTPVLFSQNSLLSSSRKNLRTIITVLDAVADEAKTSYESMNKLLTRFRGLVSTLEAGTTSLAVETDLSAEYEDLIPNLSDEDHSED